MQEIRDSFQKELDELLLLAKGFIALTNFGKFYLEKCDPNTEFSVHVRHESSPLSSVNSELVKFADILNIYTQNQNAIEEMIHTQFVQKWHDFLDRLFEHILNTHFSGISSSSYAKISGIQIKLDLSTATATNIIPSIQESALQWFNFLKAEDKLNTIQKALDWQLTDTIKRAIKKHITVRNVFQHSNGILRADDLKRLGSQEITLLDDSANPKKFNNGDRLIVTFWELSVVRDDFHAVASAIQ